MQQDCSKIKKPDAKCFCEIRNKKAKGIDVPSSAGAKCRSLRTSNVDPDQSPMWGGSGSYTPGANQSRSSVKSPNGVLARNM